MDPHGPYLPPKKYLPEGFDTSHFLSYYEFTASAERGVLDTPAYRPRVENLRQRYEGEIRLLDDQIGSLIGDLRERRRWDEAMVWVLSDHGEAFGEDDWAGHNGNNMKNVLIQVPFLLKLPRSWGVEARTIEDLVSTSRPAATLGLLGLKVPDGLFGEDLSRVIRDPESPGPTGTVVSEGIRGAFAGIHWPWKLILEPDKSGAVERMLFTPVEDPTSRQWFCRASGDQPSIEPDTFPGGREHRMASGTGKGSRSTPRPGSSCATSATSSERPTHLRRGARVIDLPGTLPSKDRTMGLTEVSPHDNDHRPPLSYVPRRIA